LMVWPYLPRTGSSNGVFKVLFPIGLHAARVRCRI
jgi:hypothetical protein